MMTAWISQAREDFHKSLLAGILTKSAHGIPSNADKDSRVSVVLASSILSRIGESLTATKRPGQSAGADFEEISANFIRQCFEHLGHLRPGKFSVGKGGGISQFDQYAHLDELAAISRANRELATALGSDYLIKPDIVVGRFPEVDAVINGAGLLVDDRSARLTALRAINGGLPVLHASISCKWTLRSDRAQNARSEGLNLVRNRKGRLPHIAVITGEPMPSRIASLALGTGDIDCVYHFALDELREAVTDMGDDDRLELLDTMVSGKRLRDISDLPLDLIT